jgi:multisubunit Na+/H+ antiporter MnhB subunit
MAEQPQANQSNEEVVPWKVWAVVGVAVLLVALALVWTWTWAHEIRMGKVADACQAAVLLAQRDAVTRWVLRMTVVMLAVLACAGGAINLAKKPKHSPPPDKPRPRQTGMKPGVGLLAAGGLVLLIAYAWGPGPMVTVPKECLPVSCCPTAGS